MVMAAGDDGGAGAGGSPSASSAQKRPREDAGEEEDVEAMRADVTWVLKGMGEVAPAVFRKYEGLLTRCASCVPMWRARFCEGPNASKTTWLKLMKRENGYKGVPKMVKEVVECAPILDAALKTIEALPDGSAKATVLDLACGKGFLSMFLSELAPPSKCQGVYLVDKGWPHKGEEPKAHHIAHTHIYGPGAYQAWPVPLDVWRRDLKQGREIASIQRRVAGRGGPAIVLGVHLCGLLSIRAVELFNMLGQQGRLLVLKPCCLPNCQSKEDKERVFSLGNHSFPLVDVAGAGRWVKNKWKGPPRAHLRPKFEAWCANLKLGIVADAVSQEMEELQSEGGFQNAYLYARNTGTM